MRLIDADALFNEFERAAWYNNADRDEIAEEILLQMPTIDAEPVVRCGRCKWGKAYKAWDGHAGFKCELFCYETGCNDFCSCGERRYSDG